VGPGILQILDMSSIPLLGLFSGCGSNNQKYLWTYHLPLAWRLFVRLCSAIAAALQLGEVGCGAHAVLL
jgi:hypothetical protein